MLRPTELKNNELAQADNVMLIGSGVPTGRWGTVKYFSVNATGSIRGFGTYIDSGSGTNEIFALTDEGYLAKKNDTGSTRITGQSWPSGSIIRTEQLGGETYIVSEERVFTTYKGTNLTVFATISPPTGLTATNFSGASGPNRISYKVVGVGPSGGTTTPSTNYVLENVPFDLTKSQYKLFWTAPSAASLAGFEIYRGPEGDETLLASIQAGITQYVDDGMPGSQTILAPVTNTTGGVKSKFICKYKDRLLLVSAEDPNKLMISGRYPFQSKFSWIDGGGYIYIDPDSGDDITGLTVQSIADRIVVYKNKSSYLVDLELITIGNYAVLDPTYVPISNAIGCSSQDTIATVENDSFYLGRDGLYVTGYEPNFLNIIRTNEVSARIRPYLANLSQRDYQTATALYVDNKYILSFPLRREMIVYDRERACFIGPWKTPFGVSHMTYYIDGDGAEHYVLGSANSNQVYEFQKTTNTDDGQPKTITLRTNKEFFDSWSNLYILRFFYTLFRAIMGSVTVNILTESRDGVFSTAKAFTITGAEVSGATGWGMDPWGSTPWGDSESTGASFAGDELTRWGPLFKQARLVQMEITTSAANSNFEFLAAKIDAKAQSSGALSSSQRV
ncbi:hypothetical protein KO465_09100 [Candidatus Micrarchaeota archaeon]|nr:hypothetical protein [Candidatus Micrarchaeota archaeon]